MTLFTSVSQWIAGTDGSEPKLTLGTAREGAEAVVLGAFQRPSELGALDRPALRRPSGGGAAHVGPGTIWLQLSLPRPDALFPATAEKLLNRYVRPLLAALTRATGVPAHYFGRDWVSGGQGASSVPIALLGFAHDATTGRCLFEALIAVSTSLGIARPSYRGRPPATLSSVAGRAVETKAVMDAVAAAYEGLSPVHVHVPAPVHDSDSDLGEDPPWQAMRDEAIGLLAAGRDRGGRLRLGGELMASQDAVARLEDAIATAPLDLSPEDLGELVDEAFSTRGAVVFGVRSLASIRDVLFEARQNMA